MMDAVFNFLVSMPPVCLIGVSLGIAIVLVPVAQWIDFRRDAKKYGKDVAWELARRY